jgi:transcriptional regulator with XRE-family HTH domain
MRRDIFPSLTRTEKKLDRMLDEVANLAAEIKKLRTQANIELNEVVTGFESPQYIASTFANNLLFLKSRYGFKNMSQFAKRLGIAQPTLYRWTQGIAREPRLSSIEPLAKEFGFSAIDLLRKDLRTVEQKP